MVSCCEKWAQGELCAYADILLEMHWYAHPDDADRRRRLHGYSRYEETPRGLVIELTADGTDYLGHGDAADVEFGRHWQLLHGVLEEATHKLTRQEIGAEWPPDEKVPDKGTLGRWLEQALGRGQVLRDGRGRKNDPFRYWLPGQEEKWRQSLFYLPEMPQLKQAQQIAEEVRRRLLEGLNGMEG